MVIFIRPLNMYLLYVLLSKFGVLQLNMMASGICSSGLKFSDLYMDNY